MPTLLQIPCSMCQNEASLLHFPCCSEECWVACKEKYAQPADLCPECLIEEAYEPEWPFCGFRCKRKYRDVQRLNGNVWCSFCHEEPAPFAPYGTPTFCDACTPLPKQFCVVCWKAFAADVESITCCDCEEQIEDKNIFFKALHGLEEEELEKTEREVLLFRHKGITSWAMKTKYGKFVEIRRNNKNWHDLLVEEHNLRRYKSEVDWKDDVEQDAEQEAALMR